jgi:uncharacterized damage-inducible protein DinB
MAISVMLRCRRRTYTLPMAMKEALLAEFDHEMGKTRRLMERLPEADLAWKPHDKSYSMGQLAAHLANLPTWIEPTCDLAVFDLATLGPDTRPRNPASTSDLLTAFDTNVARARQKIAEQTDASLAAVWTMKKDGHEMFSMPRMSALRNLVMNHSIHHRGQLTVYLRLRNVPLPALYGPTADEG